MRRTPRRICDIFDLAGPRNDMEKGVRGDSDESLVKITEHE